MSDLMHRHGFGKQVTAAMIVKKADEYLQQLGSAPLKQDVKAISFQDDVLKIAVRNSAAGYELAALIPELHERLMRDFPSANIERIIHQLHPKTFENFV